MRWDPPRYLAFRSERLRPALDLLARVDLEAPRAIVDLGCGAGNVTRVLAERWPEAAVVGVDSSAEMLAAAAREAPALAWERADAAGWAPPTPVDLLFSNAALHWLDDHAQLFPRLARAVAPGGVLAVQMPNNFAAPTHTAMAAAAAAGPWAARLAGVLRPAPVLSAAAYHALLAPLAAELDVWETEYLHALTGDNPVADWTRSTALAPLLAALEEPERSAFEAEYRRRIAAAYPKDAAGQTLLPFKRLFLVCRRAG